jgi:hypothetical protein
MAQEDCRKDSVKYAQAYDYIMNDTVNKGRLIVVSDSIVDLDRDYFFSSSLDSIERKKLECYRGEKNYKWFVPYHSNCIASWFPTKNANAEYVLFFSQVEDKMLRADLLPFNKAYVGIRYMFWYKQYHFLEGYIYLFIFDSDNLSLKKAARSDIIFN